MYKSLHKKKILLFIVLLLIAIAAGSFFIYNRYYNISFVKESFTETSDELLNPYRGWYNIYGYEINDNNTITEQSVLSSFENDKDTRLSLIEINLKNYKNNEISTEGLNEIKLIFDSLSKTNKSLIVRFLYDWDGKASETEPDNIDIIEKHINQVGSIINLHKESIYCLQGIFVGNCGEMNNSKFMTNADMTKLIKKLDSVIDNDIFLSVRTPAQYRTITSSFNPISDSDAFSGVFKSRIGLFNDGMLGSYTDLGTYGSIAKTTQKNPSDKLLRKDEITFQNTMCRFVPNGGEVVIDNSLNDIDNAVEDFKHMHISFLNNLHDLSVINKWKRQSYNGSDVFKGSTAYNYVGSHLGYRYFINSATLKFDTFKDKTASLMIGINNTGFANCYKKFNVSLYVENNDSKQLYKLSVNTDSRKWYNDSITYLNIPLDIRKYGTGNYTVYLKVSDDTLKEQIKFANHNNSKSGYKIGSLTISK